MEDSWKRLKRKRKRQQNLYRQAISLKRNDLGPRQERIFSGLGSSPPKKEEPSPLLPKSGEIDRLSRIQQFTDKLKR